jgi:hypothetical protein
MNEFERNLLSRADFISFVSGALPPTMVEAAAEWIVEEQAQRN